MADGSSERDGDSDGKVVVEGTLERDGSCETVGSAEGLFDLLVGPRVDDGRLDGEGVGKGESVGLADGLSDFEGNLWLG